MTTLADCLQLDQQDPLATLRELFALPPNTIYLDGNSLGAQPKAAMQRAHQVIEQQWGQNLISSWNSAGWYDLPTKLGTMLAPLIGASSDEVVITDSISVNLFKVLAAALRIQQQRAPQRKQIISERSNFPTDLYIVQGLTEWLALGYELVLIDAPEQLAAAINEHTAIVLLTQVNYRSGAMLDMRAINQLARAQGALTIWDLAHSAGAVPVDLHGSDTDFAVGCTYKYLNGGPGAPAYLYIAQRHLANFYHPLSGWWGHAQPFAMQTEFRPADSIRRALCGTPPIVSLSLVESGLEIFQHTDMQAIRRKSLALTDTFIALVEEYCPSHGLQLITPREHARRGSHVSLTHAHAYPLIQALIQRGVIGDYREPSVLRFGLTPLYTSFADVWHAVDTLRDILDHARYEIDAPRHAVT